MECQGDFQRFISSHFDCRSLGSRNRRRPFGCPETGVSRRELPIASQHIRQGRRAPWLGADEGGDFVGVTIDLLERPAGEEPDHQGRGKGVAGTDGVAHRGGSPRVVGPEAVGQEQAAAGPAGQGHQRQSEAAGQLRQRFPHARWEAEHRRQFGQLLIVELEDVGQLQRIADHVAVDERRPEVHVEEPQRPGRAAETSEQIALARRLAPLGETAEADGIRPGGQGERRLVGSDPVPRDILVDGESGLSVGGQRDGTVPVGDSGSTWTDSVGRPRSRNRSSTSRPRSSSPTRVTSRASAPSERQ